MTSIAGKPQSSRGRGFTVTELLVVMVIMTMLAGLAVPNFARSLETERLRAGGRLAVSMIQLARSRAITGHAHTRLLLDRQQNQLRITQLVQPQQNEMVSLTATSDQPTWEELRDNLAQARALPGGVKIVYVGNVGAQANSRSSNATSSSSSVLDRDVPGSESLLFRPDGTADDAIVVLEGARSEQLGISIDRIKLTPRILEPEELQRLGLVGLGKTQ
jgi:prepilin-type N-terminal cleavage/methylation domain-containing protein